MTTSCIKPCPAAPYPLVTYDMMAHDPSQLNFMNMETQGEGNYASTVFSDTRDQETDQGLTLSPKIQSSDPWLFDAAGAFEDQDLDALLGPVQFDLVADEARKNGLEVDALFNEQYQLPEPPAKRRKRTRELSNPLTSLEPNEPGWEHGPVSTPPDIRNITKVSQCSVPPGTGNFDQASRSCSPVISTLQHSHAVSGEAGTSSISQPPRSSDQSNRMIEAVEKPSLQFDSQDVRLSIVGARDEKPESLVLDNFEDDGSLFGDYVSSKEGSIECPPFAEPSCAEGEAELRATETSTAPPVLWDPDVLVPSVESDLSGCQPTKGNRRAKRKRPRTNKTAAEFSSIESKLSILDQKIAQISSRGFLQNLVGQAQNGASVPERHQAPTNKPSTLPYCRNSLPLCIALALAAPENAHSIEDTIKLARSNFIAFQSSSSLPRPASTHQVPSHLTNLLDGLHQKFNRDQAFRKSTVMWLTEKMVSSCTSTLLIYLNGDHQLTPSLAAKHAGGLGEEFEDPYLRGVKKDTTVEQAVEMLVVERQEHEHAEIGLNSEIQRLIAENNRLNSELQQVRDSVQEAVDLAKQAINMGTACRNELDLQDEFNGFESGVQEDGALMNAPSAFIGNQAARGMVSSVPAADSSSDGNVKKGIRYFICHLPDPMQPGGKCGARNETPYYRRGKLVERQKCIRCQRILSTPDSRQFITETQFIALGGRSEREESRTQATKDEGSTKSADARTGGSKKGKLNHSASANADSAADMNAFHGNEVQPGFPTQPLPTRGHGSYNSPYSINGQAELGMDGHPNLHPPLPEYPRPVQAGGLTLPESPKTANRPFNLPPLRQRYGG